MIDCEHRPTLIAGTRGSDGDSSVTVCRKCGEFKVIANKDGVHFSTRFALYGSYELIAASQAHRILAVPNAELMTGDAVFKPLDFGSLRLYRVQLHWCLKNGKQGNESYIVAADSPNQTPHSASNLIKKIYRESYDNNPEMSYWDAQGFALNVLQPREWTESGIQLLNADLDEGNYVPGEWRCPKCQMRLGQRFISREDLAVGVNPDPEPPECMNNCGLMIRIGWRDAADEAFRINQRIGKRVRALEQAWPDGYAMPVEEDEVQDVPG